MSYAEQFYGMMGNQALLYADNLAWFGTESYVYKSADLMMKVIQNPVAMSNKVAAFYAYLWARAKGMKASDYFKNGLGIGEIRAGSQNAAEPVQNNHSEEESGLSDKQTDVALGVPPLLQRTIHLEERLQ